MRIEYEYTEQVKLAAFKDCVPGRVYMLHNNGETDGRLRLCVKVCTESKLYMVELKDGEQCNELDPDNALDARYACEYVEIKDAVVIRGTA